MIAVMDGSAGNVLAVRVTGTLHGDDYRDVLEPRIRFLLNHFERLRVLFLMDKGFRGWTWKASWANTVLDVRHRRSFEKIAMVGAPRWEELCIKAAASLLMRGELRTFSRDELDDAWRWVRG